MSSSGLRWADDDDDDDIIYLHLLTLVGFCFIGAIHVVAPC
jgi:hypothetical protein